VAPENDEIDWAKVLEEDGSQEELVEYEFDDDFEDDLEDLEDWEDDDLEDFLDDEDEETL
jgi:hypothetical protein